MELLGGKYGEVVELWLDGAWDKARSEWLLERLYDFMSRGCSLPARSVSTIRWATILTGHPFPKNAACRRIIGDPLRMFPSDFRFWDPYMCACSAPKLYNMSPGTEGRLLQSDIDHLMEIADGLGIRRKTA